MKRSLSHLLMLSTSLLCMAPLAADTGATKMPMEKKTPECQKANNAHRFEIKHIEAKGIGYKQGYTSLDAFFTSLAGSYVPFLDLRAHLFNNGKWAANAGIGTRYIFDPCQWMVGANVYYDYRNADHDTNLNQVGVGVEAFYDRFEAHLNGYLPVGQKRKKIKTHLDSVDFKGFSGNYILQNENYNNTFQGAMKGFNAEVGAHLAGNRTQYDVYFGAGPYYYDVSDGKHSWGAKARLKAEVTKYLFFEISDSYDWIFHNRFQGSINLSVPFGRHFCYPNKAKKPCHNVMDWQAVLPVERSEIIVVSKFKKKQTIDPVAIDPTTGKPFFVLFVNNTNPSTGVGTFENPFRNLSSAPGASFPNNTIYVFSGDGTATNMSSGNTVLQANQRFLGSANSHQYQTTMGPLTIPALTSNKPKIQGITGTNNAVVLANNNEVSGFDISFNSNVAVATGRACIRGDSAIVSANINNNILTNETYGLILGAASTGTAASGTISIVNNTASLHTTGSSTAYFLQGIHNATVTMENNLGYNNTFGTQIRSFGNSTALVQNNTFNSNSTTGINLVQDATATVASTFFLQQNSVNVSASVAAVWTNLSTAGGVFICEGNSLTDYGQANVYTSTAGTVCVRFNGNTGFPTKAASTPFFTITPGGTLFNLEPPTNNYPQPATLGNVPACTCAPCP